MDNHNTERQQGASQDLTDEEPTEADHGAWIPFLKRKGRFAECMLAAWQEVEDKVDQMTIQEFELFYFPPEQDPRVDMLVDFKNLEVKLGFLKEMGRLSPKDISTIKDFSKKRNELFHGGIFTNRSPFVIPEAERIQLMELAREASQIVLNRALGVWFDEGTGDLGNKDTPKPEEPEVVKRARELKKAYVPRIDAEKEEERVP